MAHRKNSELLADPRAQFLTGIEKQRLFILRILSSQKACPNCEHRLNFFEAIGKDVDDFDLHKEGTADYVGTCPNCRRGLRHTLPLVGDWYFRLVPETAARTPVGGIEIRSIVTFDYATGRGDQRCAGIGRVVGVNVDAKCRTMYAIDVGAGEIFQVDGRFVTPACGDVVRGGAGFSDVSRCRLPKGHAGDHEDEHGRAAS